MTGTGGHMALISHSSTSCALGLESVVPYKRLLYRSASDLEFPILARFFPFFPRKGKLKGPLPGSSSTWLCSIQRPLCPASSWDSGHFLPSPRVVTVAGVSGCHFSDAFI
ncbi:unnamed protein product [Rangifer tarandus platyrhynchus]|uniref:Uncharacterized protein n=2 Tax=Rangifer tarandus platyrhynchus TaxID=3082113 RepID=A0ABN8ZSD9_RANTA|nr:unnamed protein product [Rangifer tarandus platyrhynchus]